MPINLSWDSRDAIPEQMRDVAVERDGKWIFEAETSEDVQGLKKALDDERKRRAQAEKQAKQFEGIDAEKAKQLLDETHKAEEEKAKAAGQWENWKAQMTAQHNQEKQTLTEQIAALERDLNEQMVTATAMQAIAAEKGVAALLLPHIGAKVVIDNGKREVRILDASGNVRYGKNGQPLTIAERVQEMKADPIFGRAFEATGAGGSGADSNTRAGATRGIDWSKLSPTERLKAAREAGITQ